MTAGDASDDAEREFQAHLAKAKEGDRDSVNHLLDMFRPYLVSIANDHAPRDLQQTYAPSDFVQDTLNLVHKKIGVFEGTVAGWHAYARVILINEIRRRLRDRMKRNSVPFPENELADPRSGPATEFWKKELRELLKMIQSQMNPDYQLVLKLRKQELSYSEIGKLMQRSEEAARKLFNRAMIELEKRLHALGVVDDFKEGAATG